MAPSYITFKTEIGWIGVSGSELGLLQITPPRPSAREARRLLGKEAVWSPDRFSDLIQRFEAYFRGEPVTFNDRLDLSGATVFQSRVWAATRLIPYAETRSYAWVAEHTGRPAAARAVGQALARNPLPVIIPCHRVIASSGGVGGYSGGVRIKKYLLGLEASGR